MTMCHFDPIIFKILSAAKNWQLLRCVAAASCSQRLSYRTRPTPGILGDWVCDVYVYIKTVAPKITKTDKSNWTMTINCHRPNNCIPIDDLFCRTQYYKVRTNGNASLMQSIHIVLEVLEVWMFTTFSSVTSSVSLRSVTLGNSGSRAVVLSRGE